MPIHALPAQYRLHYYIPSAEDFILRHAATLTQLELLRCKVLVSDVRLLLSSESTNLATDVELRRRPYWDRSWDRFAAELTGIVMLHVDERHRDRKYRYVQRNFAGSYSVCGGGESRNAADLAALQRFRMTVATLSKETHIESREQEIAPALIIACHLKWCVANFGSVLHYQAPTLPSHNFTHMPCVV